MKLTRKSYRLDVARWIAEDLGAGDVTSAATIDAEAVSRAVLRAKQELTVCGVPVAREVFSQIDPDVRFRALVKDGDTLSRGAEIAHVSGNTRSLLAAERTALNILQHLSGIATQTRRFADIVDGTRANVLDTRKTTPGLRHLQKYAVACGGGTNHRLGLYDMVLIKNNHITAAGSITKAVKAARGLKMPPSKIQVEVENIFQMQEAIAAGAKLILLDNMTPRQLAACVRAADGRAVLEASGGVTGRRLRAIAESGVDRISIGALTHSAPAADIHMTIEEDR